MKYKVSKMNIRERYEKMMSLISNISPRISIERFMEELIKIIISIVDPINSGLAFIPYKDGWKCAVVYGMDESLLGMRFEEKNVIVPFGDEPVVFKIVSDLFKNLSGSSLDLLRKIDFLGEGKIMIGISVEIEKNRLPFVFLFGIENTENPDSDTIETLKTFGKIAQAFLVMKVFNQREREYQTDMVKAMVKMLELHDEYTKGHGERVGNLAYSLSKELKLPDEFAMKVYWAGVLHDIGKLGVPESILNKKGKLTQYEYEKIKEHPILGEKALEEFESLQDLRPMIRHHHERYDGKGYPDGLKGEEIPLGARIIAVVDVYDALKSDRSYRKAYTFDKAIEIIKKESSHAFDPYIVDKFINMMVK